MTAFFTRYPPAGVRLSLGLHLSLRLARRALPAVMLVCLVGLMAGCGYAIGSRGIAQTGSSAPPATPPPTTPPPVTPQLTTITVAPANSTLAAGLTERFTASGLYTDGTQHDVTTTVTWSSSTPGAASISSTGLATAIAFGTTTIRAAIGNISGTATLNVATAALMSINVTPANPSIPKGSQKQFTAIGVYTDNSTQNLTPSVTWSSSATGTASISNTAGSAGLAAALAVGTATITATLGPVSGATTLTVLPAALLSIAVTPANATILIRATQQFTATGTYTDGTTADLTTTVTWMSSTPATASISNAAGSIGLATASALGTTSITAATTSTATAPGITSPAVTLTVIRAAYAANYDFANNGPSTVSQYSIGNDGLLTPLSIPTVAAGVNPFSISVDPSGRYAYVANFDYNNNTGPSTISQYTIATDGSLTPMAQPTVATGTNPNSVIVDPSGQHVYAANFTSNTVTEYTIGTDGSLTPISGAASIGTGNGAAMIAFDLAGTHAYVVNYYPGTVSQYSVAADGALTALPGNPVTAGYHANFIAIDPSGSYVYVANLGGGTISQYMIGTDGTLSPLTPAVVTTGGANSNPRSIAIDPTGRYVYVATTDTTGITGTVKQFTIDAASGALMPMATPTVLTGGNNPNSVVVDPTGQYVYVADRGSATLSQFRISQQDGSLSALTPPTVAAGTNPASVVTAP